MPIATRTFRVFVSSTFEDLKEERNALQREVFPKLRTLCEQHGARFQAIDLRWGVRNEAALDQQTMAICLREIQRCRATGVRPNFIALLGNRYGWRPLPITIPADEFEALTPHLPARDATAADQWYRLDENAVPPEYCLQPRTGEFVESSAWNPVEQSLLQALAIAARAAGLSQTELIKYEASATHQEILAGLGDSEQDRQHVFGFVRRPFGNTDPRLDALKSHLRVHEFDAGDMTALSALVVAQLSEVIEREVKRFEDRPTLDLEIEAHDRFADDRCRIFIGRQSALDIIADYIGGTERRPLLLHGESGSGKSAVMAKASQQYNGPGRMIRRFIGASPESASGHSLLTSLCRQIAPAETPVDYAQLENAFRERLSVATAEQPMVLFIDALDQLSANDPARDVTWLPSELPAHVKVILSTTDDGERLPEGLPVRLERMAQYEAGQALDELLRDAHRTLRPSQRETVLAHFERCGLPLYLKLAAEESRLWRSYTPNDACTLGEGVAGVIDTLFDRLSSNTNHGPTLVERSLGYLAAARYGLTEDEALDVLTADDTVWNDFDQRKHHEVSERRLPVVVWSRISLDLEPYLTERAAPGGTVIAFYHRQLAEHITGRFLGSVEAPVRHGDLARYFSGRPAPDTRRAVELVFQQRGAYQWADAEATLFDSQFLLAKVGAGLALDLDADYQALLQEASESALLRGEALGLVGGAVRLSLHVVAQDRAQFASQMVGRLLALRDKPGVARFVEEIAADAPRPWFRPLHPCFDSPGGALLRTLEGHSDSVEGVAVTPDGKRAVSASRDKTVRVWDLETGRALRTLNGHSAWVNGVTVTPDGKRGVSASNDETLKVWDLETGRTLGTMGPSTDPLDGPFTECVTCVAMTPDGKCAVSGSWENALKVWDLNTHRLVRTLEGHFATVNGVAVTLDGKWAVSASDDKTLRVWDLDTGRALRTLKGHSDQVNGVAVALDGKRVVSASSDHTVMVWDLNTGRALRTLKGHSDRVNCVVVTQDGKRVVSASSDETLKVWDLDTGRALLSLEGHSGTVHGVALTPDGKRAVSTSGDQLKVWDLDAERVPHSLEGHTGLSGLAVTADGKRAVSASLDKTLRVWNLNTGGVQRTLKGHSAEVIGVAVTADGKRALSASYDKTLKVWSLDTGRELRTLKGHSDQVNGVAVAADGARAVSASADKTLIVWDVDTGRALRTLDGHTSWVLGVAATPDGKRAVSASMDDTLKVWDLDTGRALLTLEGHTSHVYQLNGVAVTADGKRVVWASGDTLRAGGLDTGLLIATFRCDGYARGCAFTGERCLVAGDADGHVYFLALEE